MIAISHLNTPTSPAHPAGAGSYSPALKAHEKEPFSAQSTTRNPQSGKALLQASKNSCSSVLGTGGVYSCAVKLQVRFFSSFSPGEAGLFDTTLIFSKQLLIPPCSTIPCLVHKHFGLFIVGHSHSIVQNYFIFNLTMDSLVIRIKFTTTSTQNSASSLLYSQFEAAFLSVAELCRKK